MRLRNLYIDQLYRLKHILREKRRNYVHSLRAERESLCKFSVLWLREKYSNRLIRFYSALQAVFMISQRTQFASENCMRN